MHVPYPKENELIEAGYLEIDVETGEYIEVKPKPTAEEWAKHLGRVTGYELPKGAPDAQPEKKHHDLYLQTLKYPDELDGRLSSIRAYANSSIKEKGANILYLIVGFLEWFESKDSEKPRLAPLIALPVQIDQKRLDPKTRVYMYEITIRKQDLITNNTLSEKLKNDFGLGLPEYEDTEDVESYFNRVRDTIMEAQPRWRVRRFCTLGLLDFFRQVIYRDLDPANWPKGYGPIIKRNFFAGGRGCWGRAEGGPNRYR